MEWGFLCWNIDELSKISPFTFVVALSLSSTWWALKICPDWNYSSLRAHHLWCMMYRFVDLHGIRSLRYGLHPVRFAIAMLLFSTASLVGSCAHVCVRRRFLLMQHSKPHRFNLRYPLIFWRSWLAAAPFLRPVDHIDGIIDPFLFCLLLQSHFITRTRFSLSFSQLGMGYSFPIVRVHLHVSALHFSPALWE